MNLKDAVASGRRFRRKESCWTDEKMFPTRDESCAVTIGDAIADDWETEPLPEPERCPDCGEPYQWLLAHKQACKRQPAWPGMYAGGAPPPAPARREARRWTLSADWRMLSGMPIVTGAAPPVSGEFVPVVEILTCVCGHENSGHHPIEGWCWNCGLDCKTFRPEASK